MTSQEAINVLAQVINQTRALPHEVDTMREALRVLAEMINKKPEK